MVRSREQRAQAQRSAAAAQGPPPAENPTLDDPAALKADGSGVVTSAVVQALKGNVAPPQMMLALISVGYSESDARAAWRSGQDMKQLLQGAIESKGLTIPEEEPAEEYDASPMMHP